MLRVLSVHHAGSLEMALQRAVEQRAIQRFAEKIVHAGIQGIEEGLAAPDATTEDLSLLDGDALAARGYVRLPQSLPEALERFQRNSTVTGWFPEGFTDVYVKHKQGENAFLEGRTQQVVCTLYEQTN